MKITNATKVLITGGASGIGKLMGQIVLQKGAELIIHFVRLCQGLMPIPVFDFVVGRVLGIYKTMDQFKGRKN